MRFVAVARTGAAVGEMALVYAFVGMWFLPCQAEVRRARKKGYLKSSPMDFLLFCTLAHSTCNVNTTAAAGGVLGVGRPVPRTVA